MIYAHVFLLSLVLLLPAFAAVPSRPNILFVFIDDIGWGDLSCYGSPVTNKLGQPITPNLDKLASEGIRFTQGYVASPICSPSRTGVLTGIEPARYAIYSFLNNRAANASRNMADWVQPDTVTAPRLFKAAGYRTGQFGKWHMGGGRDVNNAPLPQDYGFEESLVAFEGMGNRILYNGDGLSLQNADVPGTIEWVEWYEGAGKHTDAALRFITNAVQAGTPFYVHVPFNDTHSPYHVPPGQENDFDHITTNTTGKTFLGELHNLDKQIGRLAAAIDGLNIATNTLIVVVGDNGAPDDALETLLKRNGGLRSGKGNIYEGGIREPFLIRWPGTVPAGVVNSNTAISTLDLLPTYCSFAGVRLPNAPFAGEDMSDVFRGSTRVRVRPLFWEYGTVSALNPASPRLAIREGNFKFLRNPDGSRRELYRIPEDHGESLNLAGNVAYANVVADLEPKLMQWYEEHVLGHVGPTYPCGSTGFTGLVLFDSFSVPGNNSPETGFGAGQGCNYAIPDRLTGAASNSLVGYRLGQTGGTSPRQASDFSIQNNRLTVAPRNGNGRFEMTPDLTTGFDFGPYLAGRVYEVSFQMTATAFGPNSQRMSLGITDVSNVAVGDLDLGLQIGSDGNGGVAVFRRIDANSNTTGADRNDRLLSGLPLGTPVNLKMRVGDRNANVTDYSTTFEILVNDVVVESGVMRFNTSTTSRYLVFDVAAQDYAVSYDDLRVLVTQDTSAETVCYKPLLNLSELDANGATIASARFFWPAQAGLSVTPEWSNDLVNWLPLTDSNGVPLNIVTPHGSIQWLNAPIFSAAEKASFFRLRR